MHPKLRVMLLDQRADRSSELVESLGSEGFEVVVTTGRCRNLEREVGLIRPDVIIVDLESPDRDTLEGMRRLGESHPRPILMFVDESDEESIRSAVRAGVAAYVVKGASPGRVRSVLQVALARFEADQALRHELEQARSSLAERKAIERAKELLAERRGLSESEAYATMRKFAMDSHLRLYEVARRVLEMAELL